MKNCKLVLFVIFCAVYAWSETVTNNLNLQNGFVYNHGLISPGSIGTNEYTFTDAGVRDITISIGQLSGVDPETGEMITNSVDLLSLKVNSLTTIDDIITAAGSFIGDGSGISNLNVSIAIPAGSISAAQLAPDVAAAAITDTDIADWNAGKVLAQNIQISDGTVVVTTNLNVQGTISGSGSGLNGVAAAGPEGSLQFNVGGVLAGNTNVFIHPENGNVAFFAKEGNLFRAFTGTEATDEGLIYALRRFGDTTEMCMFTNGVETIRLRGDGTIYASGTLEVGGLSIGGTTGNGWFIPEEGDLSMGTFTQE